MGNFWDSVIHMRVKFFISEQEKPMNTPVLLPSNSIGFTPASIIASITISKNTFNNSQLDEKFSFA